MSRWKPKISLADLQDLLRDWKTIDELTDLLGYDSRQGVRARIKALGTLPVTVGKLERRTRTVDFGRPPHEYRWVPYQPPPAVTAYHISLTPDGRQAREEEALRALRFFRKPVTARQVANLASMTYPDALGALERLAVKEAVQIVERSARSLYAIRSEP